MIVSPSLDGVLSHGSTVYGDIRRPVDILRVLDGPASKRRSEPLTEEERAALSEYFADLYALFMKRLTAFAVEDTVSPDLIIQLQALLHEMVKVKEMGRGKTCE